MNVEQHVKEIYMEEIESNADSLKESKKDKKLYRKELCDLSNPEEGDLMVEIAGLSMKNNKPADEIRDLIEKHGGKREDYEFMNNL